MKKKKEKRMNSDWILEVLSELKLFAEQHDLPLLAEQLDDTAIVALSEIASKTENKIHAFGAPDRSLT